MFGEVAPALRKCNGMGKDAVDSPTEVPEMAIRLWRMRNSVSRSTSTSWGEQEVEVLRDGAGERVLNWNRGSLYRSVDHRGKRIGGERKRNDDRIGDKVHRGFVAE